MTWDINRMADMLTPYLGTSSLRPLQLRRDEQRRHAT